MLPAGTGIKIPVSMPEGRGRYGAHWSPDGRHIVSFDAEPHRARCELSQCPHRNVTKVKEFRFWLNRYVALKVATLFKYAVLRATLDACDRFGSA